jgi:hypothetical protein
LKRAFAGVFAAAGALGGVGCAWLIGVTGETELATPPDGSPDEASVEGGPIANESGVPEAGVESGADAGASDPGKITCNGAACAVPASQCCGDVDAGASCQAAATACSGLVRLCDETADCPLGTICCVSAIQPKLFATECKAACGPGEPQACATRAECGDAGACLAWTCGAVRVSTCNRDGADGGC